MESYKMEDLISIIVPVYKTELYLAKCVESLLSQTYKNFELILVDDGSPDQCGAICDEYAQQDHRVKVIHKDNGGLSEARNTGIDMVRGEWITFIDSDDWVDDDYLDHLYSLLRNTGSDISVSNLFAIYETDDPTPSNTFPEIVNEYDNYEALEQFAGARYMQMVHATGKIYRKDLFKEIRFPVGKFYEDAVTSPKIIYQAKKIVVTTKQLLFYRIRSDSTTSAGFNSLNYLDKIDMLLEGASFFEGLAIQGSAIKSYQICFSTYRKIFKHYNFKVDGVLSDDYWSKYELIKNKLLSGQYSFTKKLFTMFYYRSPYFADKLYKYLLWFYKVVVIKRKGKLWPQNH
jgi:glycosyltransferase involved in cell wall biosynthesis